MIKRISLTLALFTGFSSMMLYGQEKETFKDSYTHFLIEYRDVVTQKYADSIGKSERQRDRKWSGQVSPLVPPPPAPPPVAVYDRNINIHLKITPRWYVSYRIFDVGFNDTITRPEVYNIKKINRSDMMLTAFSPMNFESRTTPLYYDKDDTYKIVKVNKSKTRKICGYSCYQIVLGHTRFPNQSAELYVTEEIELNYHPVFNYKSYLQKYYPLYGKIYNTSFPDDVYEEFLFHKL